jgi:membrane-associated protease RseP (regulator of RpoE activity)
VNVRPRDAALHLGLFAACCVTTWWFGYSYGDAQAGSAVDGLYFAATLMGILACHELGHYVIGRRRGIEVSLPYFIPMPPQLTFGTLGAVIRMRDAITDRKALFDVGAAGPVAGLLVAIPLLVVGLVMSPVEPMQPGGFIEGNSILYLALKYAVFGRWLPGDGVDVRLHPMAFAGWVGLLITMINLMPIGQLDGGHIARAALGQGHEKWSARFHVTLPVVGLAVGGVMFAVARGAERSVLDALSYAQAGAVPWLVWTLMLGWMRHRAGEYHPAVGDTPLDSRRRGYACAMLVVFLLIATPVPFRPTL